ncbi:unnamed protein product, partial [Mesorhabditis belari]|uniref:F-box domain-containing protein n=1 Tax=Mesorhabditis belari TaxID=2138241 RepID=A0AAF3E9G3_9BILA
MDELPVGNFLPDVIICQIFKYLRLIDIQNASLTCKAWGRNGTATIRRLQDSFMYKKRFLWQRIVHPSNIRHPIEDRIDSAMCFSPSMNSVYLFGGTNLRRVAAFNDMFRFDMDRLCWSRVITKHSIPQPKGQATMTRWGSNCMVVYGGNGPKPPSFATSPFHSEVYLYYIDEASWTLMSTTNEGPRLSGHAAIVMHDHLIVFGGRLAEQVANHTLYAFDLKKAIWKMPKIQGVAPNGRYGATFVPITSGKLLLANGVPFLKDRQPEPNEMANSNWILSFNPEDFDGPWTWTKKLVHGLKCDDTEEMRNSCSAVAWWEYNGRIRLASLGTSPKPQTSRDTLFAKEYKNIEDEMRRLFNEMKANLERCFRERIEKLKRIREGLAKSDDELLDPNLSFLSSGGYRLNVSNLWNRAQEAKMMEVNREEGLGLCKLDARMRSIETRSAQTTISVVRESKEACLLDDTDLADIVRAIRQSINSLQLDYYSKPFEPPEGSLRFLLRRACLPRFSLFLADVTNILKEDTLVWEAQPIEMRASPLSNRFSFLAAKGELLLHGGITGNESCVGGAYLLSLDREG